MGRYGGYGCAPCGGYINNSYGNKGWNSGANRNNLRNSYANKNRNVAAKNREVYYEKETCYNSNDQVCCASNDRNNCNSWDGGCKNYGCNSGYGGGWC